MTAPSKRTDPGKVYLFWAERTFRFKIGFTRNLSKRWEALETSSPFPLLLIAAVDGLASLEKDIHHRYANFRVHGEWFEFPEQVAWSVFQSFGCTLPAEITFNA